MLVQSLEFLGNLRLIAFARSGLLKALAVDQLLVRIQFLVLSLDRACNAQTQRIIFVNATAAMAALFVHPSLSAPWRPATSCHPSLSIIRLRQCVPMCASVCHPLRLMITFSQVTQETCEQICLLIPFLHPAPSNCLFSY